MSNDHSLILRKMLGEALKNHSLSKRDFENEKLVHSFSVNYSKARQVFSIVGTMHCPELCVVIKRSLSPDSPVYSYSVGAIIGMWPFSFDLEGGLNAPFITDHVEQIVSKGILPIVKSVRTPVDAVKYAIEHRGVLGSSGAASDRDLGRWTSHYGIPFAPRKQGEDSI